MGLEELKVAETYDDDRAGPDGADSPTVAGRWCGQSLDGGRDGAVARAVG